MPPGEQPHRSDAPNGFRSQGVPERYRGHPLLTGGPYFTLPAPLLNRVVAEVGKGRFDAKLVEMESALSEVCGDHSSNIGFWRGQAVNFLHLRPDNDLTFDFFVQNMVQMQWCKTEHEARAILDLLGQRLDWASDVRKAYCGWLMTNTAFLDEHARIFETWLDQVTQSGVPNMGPVVRDALAVPGSQLAEGEVKQFIREFEGFFIRWRLDDMPAPFLPNPMGPHLPVMDLSPVLGHMRSGGTIFYLPDIFPVPSRDKVREMLEEALRDLNGPEHLAEWFNIVHSDNVAKNQIPRYARVFEVQHYTRAVYARHATALQRKKSALIIALAAYLGVSDDTVERDLSLIADRLGADWRLPSP